MAGNAERISNALESVLARFGENVRRVGWRYRLTGHELDELIQEVRIRLWHARGSGDLIEESPASYVYRTAVTSALNVIRRRRAGRATDVRDDTPAPGHDAARMVEISELAQHVERALATLAADRQAAVRAHLSGYSRREIAQLMGWSDIKTKNLLARGLADLRGKLTEQGIHPAASP